MEYGEKVTQKIIRHEGINDSYNELTVETASLFNKLNDNSIWNERLGFELIGSSKYFDSIFREAFITSDFIHQSFDLCSPIIGNQFFNSKDNESDWEYIIIYVRSHKWKYNEIKLLFCFYKNIIIVIIFAYDTTHSIVNQSFDGHVFDCHFTYRGYNNIINF